jgi:hypothetical protein
MEEIMRPSLVASPGAQSPKHVGASSSPSSTFCNTSFTSRAQKGTAASLAEMVAAIVDGEESRDGE